MQSFLNLLYFLYLLNLPFLQQPPADAAEISRELLYHPAVRIDADEQALLFRAERFSYLYDRGSGRWNVRAKANFRAGDVPRAVRRYRHEASGQTYEFAAADHENEGVLEIRPFTDAAGEPVARVRLWTRAQLAEAWFERLRRDSGLRTPEELARELTVSEPEVAAVAADGAHLWLAIRYYAGEGSLGLGSIIRFDPRTNAIKLFQPPELATTSITHLAAAGGALWLGTLHEGEGHIEPTGGLVRFDPASGAVLSFAPGASPLLGSMVTALRTEATTLWAATDEGICRVGLESPPLDWTCWRVVPVVQVTASVAVSNRPGGKPRGQLPPGTYEVRWANVAFLEVLTPDAMEGWLAIDDLQDYIARQFDAREFELANTYGGGAGVMRLLEKPDGDALSAAQVYRAPLERAGAPNEGWQRVRARVGWIPRANLQVTPQIQPREFWRFPKEGASAPGGTDFSFRFSFFAFRSSFLRSEL
jgi:hypothetical protein